MRAWILLLAAPALACQGQSHCDGTVLTECGYNDHENSDHYFCTDVDCAATGETTTCVEPAGRPFCAVSATPDPACATGSYIACDGSSFVECDSGYAVGTYRFCPLGGCVPDVSTCLARPGRTCTANGVFCDGDIQVKCDQEYEAVVEECLPGLCYKGYCRQLATADSRCTQLGHYTVCAPPYTVECIDQYLIGEYDGC